MGRRKSWTKEQKLAIVKQAEGDGVTATIRAHEISHATFYNWRKKVQELGDAAFDSKRDESSQEVKKLREENAALKELLADKELALRAKDLLLKKTIHRSKNA